MLTRPGCHFRWAMRRRSAPQGPSGPQAVKAKPLMRMRAENGGPCRRCAPARASPARFPACDGQPLLIGAGLVPVACATVSVGDHCAVSGVTSVSDVAGRSGLATRRRGRKRNRPS